jgi:antitoxin component YwqK of YwqJK toxin-antitoxin module
MFNNSFLSNTLCFLACIFLHACSTDNSQPSPNPKQNLTEAIVLEIITIKNDSGKVVEEYQMDKIRKIKHGYEKIYYSNGKLMRECNYKMGQTEGKEIIYYDNGQIQSEIINNNNRRNGIFKHYYNDGKLEQEGIYKNDGIEGLLKVYYNNGNLKETLNFKNGEANGEFVEYNDNNSLKAKGSYLTNAEGNEIEHGLLELYDKNGKITSKMDCEMGACYTIWTIEKGNITPKKLPK